MAVARPRTTVSKSTSTHHSSARDGAPRPAATRSAAARPAASPATVDDAVEVTTPTTFEALGVPAALIAVLRERGITEPFPIQTATLPDSLAGRDVLGRGRTGSGKTYAFALPVLARLAANPAPRRPGRPRALILAPTRELASQIDAALAPLAAALSLTTMTVFGGVGAGPQISKLRAGVDVLVACPGRLADHIQSGHAKLDQVEITVLDEADHMADLGFLPVVRRLLDQTPATAQRLLFSATLDRGVDVLVQRYLTNPVTHSVDSAESPVSTMAHHVLHIRSDDRLPVLVDLTAAPGRTVVFTRTKQRAKRLTRDLIAAGVPAVELHGNLAQNARARNLLAFSDGSANTLVATDIAARGIHVDDVALVVHADPPVEHKAYLHRSGRTARAGADGVVITLMTDDQVSDVRDLTRRAAIKPTITRLRPGDELLSQLAPGPRTFTAPPPVSATSASSGAGDAGRSGGNSGNGGSKGSGRSRRPSSGARAGTATRVDGGRAAEGGGRGQRRRGGSAGHGGGGTGGRTAGPTVYSTSTGSGGSYSAGAGAHPSSGAAHSPKKPSGAAAFSSSARPTGRGRAR